MSSHVPAPAAAESVGGEMDLEKGGAFPIHISRKDSAMPRVEDGRASGRGGSVGSGDTRSSGSKG